jgi:hypothetical protein
MSKFGYIKEARLTLDRTANFTFHGITVNGKSPILVVRPASELNKGYFNALLRRSARMARRVAAGKMDVAMISENREEDRGLYPKHVVIDWQDVLDEEGNEVKFSRDDCLEFINAIDNHVFDELRNFCASPESFAEDLNLDVGETEKN